MLEFSKRLGLCLGIAAAFAFSACDSDTESVDSGKETPAQQGCTSNDDCKSVEGKPICDTEKKECIAEPGGTQDECKEDADCKDSSKSKCNSGKCVADGSTEPSGEKGCTSNEDCPEATPVCNANGTCIEAPKVDDDPLKDCTGDDKKVCGESCAHILIDIENCGDCGTKCDKDKETCSEGKCVSTSTDTCESKGLTTCDGASECVDTRIDSKNCGTCGNECKDGKVCTNGTCANVDACNNACVGDQICIDGTCKLECGNDRAACTQTNTCADLQTDSANCGTCGKACDKSQACVSGNCEDRCSGNTPDYCDGNCVNVKTNADHCGECGKNCDSSKGEACSDGKCVEGCPENQIRCGSACIDPKTDANYCGAKNLCTGEDAGVYCPSGKCEDGQCTPCGDGKSVCKPDDERESKLICADPSTSADNCGCDENSPGVKCGALANVSEGTCESKACIITCVEGFGDCNKDTSDGCEVSLKTVENCGACGTVCGGENAQSASCDTGICQLECKEGTEACNSKCINLKSDKENCGFCGNACGQGQSCEDGACVISDCSGSGGYVENYEVVTKAGDTKKVKAFCIDKPDTLKSVVDAINKGQKYPTDNSDNAYILVQPIEIDSSWTPIGTSSKPFTGYFIGNGRKITGKGTIMLDGAPNGFFGTVKDAVIDGFVFNNVSFVSTDSDGQIGIIAGKAQGSMIRRSVVTGSTIQAIQKVGGLVGYSDNSTIEKCSFEGKVNSSQNAQSSSWWDDESYSKDSIAGGLAGLISKSTIIDSTASGTLTAKYKARYNGGLVGKVESNSTIKNCTATVDLNVQEHSAGGLVGRIDNSTITESHAKGNVKAVQEIDDYSYAWYYIGGLVGYASSATIETSDASGEVHGGYQVGGLVGRLETSSNVKNCSSSAKIFAKETVGGVIGYSQTSNVTSTKSSATIKSQYLLDWDAWGVGGFVGEARGGVYKDNEVTKDASLQLPKNRAWSDGGFIGYGYNGVKISNCTSAIDVSGTGEIGGFAGQVGGGVTFENCSASGTVTGTEGNIGGFVGYSYDNSTYTNCTATGDVKSTNATYAESIGGFGGYMSNNSSTNTNITVEGCKASGSVEGTRYIGGFVGNSYYVNYSKCTASGDVKSREIPNNEDRYYIGGFIGYFYYGSVDKSEVTGNVDATSTGSSYTREVGGFIGRRYYGKITQSKVTDTIVTGGGRVGGFIGDSYTNTQSTTQGTEGNSFAGQVIGTSSYVGGLIGYNEYNYGYFRYNTVYGTVTSSSSYVGGFMGGQVGNSYSYSTFSNNVVVANVSGSNYVGGFIGYMYHCSNELSMDHIMVIGDITGYSYSGGILGYDYSCGNGYCTRMYEVFMLGKINTSSSYTGSMIGYRYPANYVDGQYTFWFNKAHNNNYVIGYNSYTYMPSGSYNYEYLFNNKNQAYANGQSQTVEKLLNQRSNSWVEAECKVNAAGFTTDDTILIPVLNNASVLPNHKGIITCETTF